MRARPKTLMGCFLLLFSISSFAQHKMPDKEEMKKLLEQMLQQYPPSEREKMRKQLEANLQKGMESGVKQMNETATYPSYFPAPKKEALDKLPKQTLQGASLQAYLKKILADVTTQLTAEQLGEINKLSAGKKPMVLNQLAIMAFFYQNNPLAGYVLAAKACDVPNPGALELNNLAAMLQLGSWPQKALPILQYIEAKYPGNPVVCNNIGQAYALLGEKEKTRFYLLACLKTAPLHPEANNTMAHLEASNNNMAQAATYAANSLKGGYTQAAQRIDAKIPSKNRATYLPDINLPDAFNEFKIQEPPSMFTVEDMNIFKEARENWYKKWWAEVTKLMELRNKYDKEDKAQMEKDLAIAQQEALKGRIYTFGRPFSSMAIAQDKRRSRHYKSPVPGILKSWRAERDENWNNFQKKKKSLGITYAEKMKGLDCGQGPKYKGCELLMKLEKELCGKLQEASNEHYRNNFSINSNYWKKLRLEALKEYYYSSYIGYLAGINEAQAKSMFYGAALQFLQDIGRMQESPMYGGDERDWTGCPPEYKKGRTPIEMNSKWEPECPIDAELPFFVGKIKLNCKEASFSMGAGPAGFSFSQNFETHQYTFSVGIGASIDKTFKIPGVEGKVEASINQSIYITYDGKKKMTDLGMKFGAGVSAGYGFGGSLPGGAGLDEDGVLTPIGGPGWSKDGGKIEDSFGYTISINSGFEPNISFTESKLTTLFPGEKQINPNVKLK